MRVTMAMRAMMRIMVPRLAPMIINVRLAYSSPVIAMAPVPSGGVSGGAAAGAAVEDGGAAGVVVDDGVAGGAGMDGGVEGARSTCTSTAVDARVRVREAR